MKAVIEGYMRGGGKQYTSRVILRVLDNIERVESLIGKIAVYQDSKNNVYRGRILRRHGKRNPTLIAVFKPNLPGQAIGSLVEIVV